MTTTTTTGYTNAHDAHFDLGTDARLWDAVVLYEDGHEEEAAAIESTLDALNHRVYREEIARIDGKSFARALAESAARTRRAAPRPVTGYPYSGPDYEGMILDRQEAAVGGY